MLSILEFIFKKLTKFDHSICSDRQCVPKTRSGKKVAKLDIDSVAWQVVDPYLLFPQAG